MLSDIQVEKITEVMVHVYNCNKKNLLIIINIKFMLITEMIHERHNVKEKTDLFFISWR